MTRPLALMAAAALIALAACNEEKQAEAPPPAAPAQSAATATPLAAPATQPTAPAAQAAAPAVPDADPDAALDDADEPAGAAGPNMAAVFGRLDADGDKKVNSPELSVLFERRFARADADKNGELTEEEFESSSPGGGQMAGQRRAGQMAGQQRGGQMGGQRMARFDSDGNGTLNRQEFVEIRVTRFMRLDKDGDGALSEAEFEAFGGRRAGAGAAQAQ